MSDMSTVETDYPLCRQQFEKWIVNGPLARNVERSPDDIRYVDGSVNLCWLAWQQSWKASVIHHLEEAYRNDELENENYSRSISSYYVSIRSQ